MTERHTQQNQDMRMRYVSVPMVSGNADRPEPSPAWKYRRQYDYTWRGMPEWFTPPDDEDETPPKPKPRRKRRPVHPDGDMYVPPHQPRRKRSARRDYVVAEPVIREPRFQKRDTPDLPIRVRHRDMSTGTMLADLLADSEMEPQ